MNFLTLGALVGTCLSMAVSVLFFIASATSQIPVDFSTAVFLSLIGLVGVVAGIIIIWSDRHNGRWGLLGLGFSFIYLIASVAPPVYLTTAKYYGPIALIVVSLAAWSVLKRRLGAH